MGYNGNNNLLFPNGPTYVNGGGVSFSVSGWAYNLYYSTAFNAYRLSGANSSGTMTLQVASTNITNPLVDVTATTNTATNTNTAANLSGAVTVNVANGSAAYLLNRKMNIVSSTGLSGTFSGVTTSQNLSFLTPYLSYDANNVYLSYGLTPFSTVAKNINHRDTESLGIIPRSIHHIFEACKHGEHAQHIRDFQLHCSFVQIYNENLFDMLR